MQSLPETLLELRLNGEPLSPGVTIQDLPLQSLGWVTRFTALRTLRVRPHGNFDIALPADLAGMAALRDLELGGPLVTESAGCHNVYQLMYEGAFAAGICALTGLTRLALSDTKLGMGVVLLEEWTDEPDEDDPQRLDLHFPLPEAVTALQALRSLSITGHAMSCELIHRCCRYCCRCR